jgi:hypothetical protein
MVRREEELSSRAVLAICGAVGGLVLTVVIGFQSTVDTRQNEALAEVRTSHQTYDTRQDQVLERISDKLQSVSENMHAVAETVRMIDERGTKFSLVGPREEKR